MTLTHSAKKKNYFIPVKYEISAQWKLECQSSDMTEASVSAPSCPVLSVNHDLDPAATAEDISRERWLQRRK